MALSLLVYNLGQWQLRQALVQKQETVPDQLGKPTALPTLRWVFQCFVAVHLVVFQGVIQIVNLTDERHHILQFLVRLVGATISSLCQIPKTVECGIELNQSTLIAEKLGQI